MKNCFPSRERVVREKEILVPMQIAMSRIGDSVAANLRISVEPASVVEFTPSGDCQIDRNDLLCDMKKASSKVFTYFTPLVYIINLRNCFRITHLICL